MRARVQQSNPGRQQGRARADRLRLFRRDWLESLTLMPPRLFAAVWGPVLMAIGWISYGVMGIAAWFATVAAGMLLWSLFEYAMHRFIFHFEPRSALGRRAAFVMHGNHHANPHDPHRAMMPLVVSLPWSAAIWAACVLALGAPGTVLFLGFAAGYVVYDAVHHACHQLPVKNHILRALRRHHLHHHFSRQEGSYAITLIFWDRLFNTRADRKHVRKSVQ